MRAELPGGLSLYYEITGEGPPLLLINGYGNHHLSWGPIPPFLAKHFQVIAFDNRGVGQTRGGGSSFTLSQMGKDALHLLDHLHIHKAHIIGHSMGGCILQELLIDHPDRVGKAVLYTTMPYCTPVQQKQMEGVYQLFQLGVSPEMLFPLLLPLLFGNPFLSTQYRKIFEFFIQDTHPLSLEGMQGQMGAFFPFDARARLKEIKNPLLILLGEEDISAPRYLSDLLVTLLPHALCTLIPQVGHTIHLENPQAFVEAVLNFLHAS